MNKYNTILFPSDYFNKNNVDPDLQSEYVAAMQTGLFKIILFDYDRYLEDGKLTLVDLPEAPCGAIYRGWMLKPEKYRSKFLE